MEATIREILIQKSYFSLGKKGFKIIHLGGAVMDCAVEMAADERG
jgi:hypothetical protein